jgi:regulator of nucleoside diphosphate kinase
MTNAHDLVLCMHDREVLAGLMVTHGHALEDLMRQARFVADDALPTDRIRLGSIVSYAEDDGGTLRTIQLVHPTDAEPANGRISVLSAPGLALIGRARGSVTRAVLPSGKRLKLRVLVVRAVHEPDERRAA